MIKTGQDNSRGSADHQIPAALLQEARRRYGIGPNYARAYLDFWQRSRQRTFATLDEILKLPPPEPMWFDYAMSSLTRGRDFYRFVREHLRGHEKRYLDVGCGFGGCLAAFAEQGMDVVGIELDPLRVELSRAMVLDAGLHDRVHRISILEENLPARLGAFDVITCLDVIEHVLDVPLALQNMSRLLRPGGLLLLEIPNKDSVCFVSSDGHFNLYGITQLDREHAIEYHRHFFGFEYDVGYYFELRYYVKSLEKQGLRCTSMASPLHPARIPDEWPEIQKVLARGYDEYLRQRALKLSPDMRRRIRRRLAVYEAGLRLNHMRRIRGWLSMEAFHLRYLTDFWLVLARKATDQR